jgi:hypothetical protein
MDKKFNLCSLQEVTKDIESIITFLQTKGCLRKTPPTCPVCARVMTCIKFRPDRAWRCPSHKNQTMSIRKGSIFENSNLPMTKIVQLLYLWYAPRYWVLFYVSKSLDFVGCHPNFLAIVKESDTRFQCFKIWNFFSPLFRCADNLPNVQQ